MSIIVIGAGEVGYNVARKLSQERKEIVLIDKDEEKVERVSESLDVQTVHGSGSSLSVLKRAGIEKASIVIAVTDSDEVNMISCLVAGVQAIVPVKIARIRDPEYVANEKILGKDKLDIDLVINTDQEMVRYLMRILEIPKARDVVEFASGRVMVVGFLVERGSPLAGKMLEELGREYPSGVIVAAIYRDQGVIVPRGKDYIVEGDLLYLLGERGVLLDLLSSITGEEMALPHRVMILGGGNVGLLLAKALEARGIAPKIVEPDEERCQFLASELDKSIVLKWDLSPYEELMEEEHVREMDVFMALSEDEEKNILFALLAKTMGAKRVIAAVHRISLIAMAYRTGVDVVVSPSLLAVNRILQYIRKGKVLNVAVLPEEQAEVIETVAMETSDLVKKPLKDLRLPPGTLVGAILREDEVLIPRGDTLIQPGDKVTLVTSSSAIPQLEKFLMVKLEYW